MNQGVVQSKMDLIIDKFPEIINIHDGIVIYSISDENHGITKLNYIVLWM